MRIAQVAPLTEAVPPKLYGGTKRVVHWADRRTGGLGQDVTLFASGDSQTSAKLDATWPRALRLDGAVRDPNALHISAAPAASINHVEGVGVADRAVETQRPRPRRVELRRGLRVSTGE